MAEVIGIVGSLAGIASAGVSVVSALTKFGISVRGSNEKICSLAGRVSLTASVLSDISATVKEHVSDFKDEEFRITWAKVMASGEESYGRVEKGLLIARNSSRGKSLDTVHGS